MYLAFLTPGIGEICVVLVVVFLLFGGEQTPKIARAFGKVIKEFKSVMNEIRDGDDRK